MGSKGIWYRKELALYSRTEQSQRSAVKEIASMTLLRALVASDVVSAVLLGT
jgi:hypothetical protein